MLEEFLSLLKSNKQFEEYYSYLSFYADLLYCINEYEYSKVYYEKYFENLKPNKFKKIEELDNFVYSSIKYLELLDKIDEKKEMNIFKNIVLVEALFFSKKFPLEFEKYINNIYNKTKSQVMDEFYKQKRFNLFVELYINRM